MMTGLEEREISPVTPDIDGRSETDEFDLSSIGSTASSIAAAYDLHRHNAYLIRDKHELEVKHNEEVLALRRRIADLERQLAQLTAGPMEMERERSLNGRILNLSQKLEIELEKSRTTAQRFETVKMELDGSKETIRLLQEENKQLSFEVNDLKNQLSVVQFDLAPKNAELAGCRQSIADDEKDSIVTELKKEIEIRDQHIVDLLTERDADNARMQSVMDVQMAHEALRKSCQEKDRHIQHLEEVLDQTIREKERMSSGIIQIREELGQKGELLNKLEEQFKEFKRDSERQYEDTCQHYIAKLNDLSMISYGAMEYPGKQDNVFPKEEKSSLVDSPASARENSTSRNSFIEYGSELNESIRCQIDLLAVESARTIEAIRSEYEIEVTRNAQLQRENDRLMADRERLKVELYGEMQNGALSSLNCVLLTRKVDSSGDSSDTVDEIARSFRCIKEELQKTVSERDVAKTKLERFMSDLQQISARNHELTRCVEKYERDIAELRVELKQKHKWYFDNLASINRCKALVFQKQYLETELVRIQKAYHNACKRFSFNGVTKRNGNTSFSCVQLHFRSRSRFRTAVIAVMATGRMRKLVEKRRKQERLWFSG